jgi:hypothetical protein
MDFEYASSKRYRCIGFPVASSKKKKNTNINRNNCIVPPPLVWVGFQNKKVFFKISLAN